jgi:hypothetical protein
MPMPSLLNSKILQSSLEVAVVRVCQYYYSKQRALRRVPIKLVLLVQSSHFYMASLLLLP